MKAKLKDYICIDLQRAFRNWKMPVGIFGVCVAFLYNSYEPSDVVSWISLMIIGTTLIMAAFIFSIYPYATAFCEDMEHRSNMQFILRGSSFSYACSKLLVVFFSSVFTMLSGFLLTVFIIYLRYGLPAKNAINNIVDAQGHYYQLLEQGNYMLYFLFAGLQIASLAGTLAVLGLVCSLFVRNRMLVYILPVAFFYVQDIMAARFLGVIKGSVFSLNGIGIQSLSLTVEGQSWQMFYLQIFAILLCSGAIMCWKMGRR
ncbi:MAG: hypothetical protein IJA32_16940 [Lachnospiraceae bacterium]|nr:hypothetical protein [Lachnospiraceae bacterium]MBQ7065550.1 hypothetical protein [Lachnospiraceae bacterium]